MEERINFISESYEIEGLIEKNDGDLGVVVTHPHPLYGGDMYNPVVETLVRVYRQKGFTTLRFNFRGAGNSQGHFDNGRGEQKDVCSAFEYLTAAGVKTIDLAGYSFGAWVNAYINPKEVNFENMIMVSPPVGFIEFTDANLISYKSFLKPKRREIKEGVEHSAISLADLDNDNDYDLLLGRAGGAVNYYRNDCACQGTIGAMQKLQIMNKASLKSSQMGQPWLSNGINVLDD